MIERIRTVDVDIISLDELVELSATARSFTDECEKLGVDSPDWLAASTKTIRRAIRSRTADSLEKSLQDKKSRLEATLPAEEKRKKLADEIAALEAKLDSVGA